KFDYIVAHGVYSWAPAQVQDALLRVRRENLSDNGIVFVSYNAYPGGHLRKMLREMMFFHIRQFGNAEERLKQAMALMRFLSESKETPDLYVHFLKEELNQMVERSAGHLYHDELAD